MGDDCDTAMSACSGMMKAINMAMTIVIYNVRMMYNRLLYDVGIV